MTDLVLGSIGSPGNVQLLSLKNPCEIFLSCIAWESPGEYSEYRYNIDYPLLLVHPWNYLTSRNDSWRDILEGNGYFIMVQSSEGLMCHAHGVAGSNLVQAVFWSWIKVCVWRTEGLLLWKMLSIFCLPAGVIATVLYFPPQGSFFLFSFYPWNESNILSSVTRGVVKINTVRALTERL